MAARKRAPGHDGPPGPSSLRFPRGRAAEQIKTQIEKGIELRDRPLTTKADLDQAQNDRYRWSDFNSELLSRLFDNRSMVDEYENTGPMIFFARTTFQQDVEEFRGNMSSSINRLTSVLDRLDLIPDPNDHKSPGVTGMPESDDIFIVHGRDHGAKEAVARFLMKLDLKPLILHEQANQGMTIIEKIERNAQGVRYVVVLLTPDDVGALKGESPHPRARQNVVFELGWFCGKLGRERVCALLVEGVERFSDYPVAYVPMDPAGAWERGLARELRAARIDFDYNKAV